MTDELAPFRAHLLPGRRHEELAEQLFGWLMAHCTCALGAERHAMDAYVASSYELHCAPADATMAENLLCAQYVAVTLLADDAYDGLPDLSRFVTYLRTGQVGTEHELVSCYRSIVATMTERGLPAAGFERAVRDTIDARMRERELDLNTVDWAAHWSVRRHTIAVAPYVWCHRVARDLRVPAEADAALRAAGVLELVSECVARGNDIASYLREAEPPPGTDAPASLNSVLHYARDLGSVEAGVRAAVTAYRVSVAAFRNAADGSVSALAQRDSTVRDYLEILSAVLAGNVAAIRHLSSHRYPGARQLLDELSEAAARRD
ncbi:terpene synthase family protein [Nocardia spumae]|uniref:terpene synthase family protein n=1 Tax=Nocardia spumae TaxID=2887190 RepID=UPI001D15C969|nr:terpene synthase family protein [Nocardia spumae]